MSEVEEDVKQAPETEEPSTSSVEESKPDAELEQEPQTEKVEEQKRSVPVEAIIKERRRRKEEVAELRAEIDGLKESLSKVNQGDPIKELVDDLGVDEETARKLHKHGLGKKEEPKKTGDDLIQERFIREANDISQEYEDWADMRETMAEILEKEARKTSDRLALLKGPEYYYLQAKVLAERKEKESSVKKAIQKASSKNLASSESGSGVKEVGNKPKKGTREWLSGLSEEDFIKHHDYINAELARGGFKE